MALFEWQNEEWKQVSRGAGIAWLSLYALFFVYALADRNGFLFVDNVNLMIHEAGHFFFSWFGHTVMILGGTLGELLAPMLCATYFLWKRETAGFAFCGFWFFENFLYIGTYMADARAQALPLVGSGEHDWGILFGQWNLILQDRRIGELTRGAGWIGMAGIMAWFAVRIFHGDSPKEHFLEE